MTMTDMGMDAQQTTLQDTTFGQQASEIGLAEVNAGQLALERAQDPETQAFAQRMVEEHTEQNQELLQILQQSDITPASQLNPEDQQKLAALANTSDDQFDQTYLQTQVEGHQTAIQLFTTEAQQGQNEELKQFATESLPLLQEHLEAATQALSTLGQGGVTTPPAARPRPTRLYWSATLMLTTLTFNAMHYRK